MAKKDASQGLPADLAAALSDPSLVVPRDATVFHVVATWANAPAATASADIPVEPDLALFERLYDDAELGSSTTPAAC